uniref:Peptidase A1 domain-containing protein n=1 Tax=Alexandrium monilatum TaxID=311494 RepID=A0A7S4Q7Q5_9DINO
MLPHRVPAGVLALLLFRAAADGDGLPGYSDAEETEVEDMALLQQKTHLRFPNSTTAPYLIPLRRELSPVIRRGRVVSHRASYSGLIRVGQPAQEFRVVFDTGSAHVVLPSVACGSTACMKHVRYDIWASETGEAIYLDGRAVPPGRVGESVTIGFGTARVTGDFVRERICFGPVAKQGEKPGPCVRSQAVMATEMSARPFEQFGFDGIVGLGLPALALNGNFSLFDQLARSGQAALPRFGFFLAEGDDGEAGEIAVGGHNPERLLEPISWVPTAKPELGYWQVKILAVHINGMKMDICAGGDCHGILDSGTSHLGIPSAASDTFNELLTQPAGGAQDCRRVDAPAVLLELSGLNITLYPENYMRLKPLPPDILGDANITVSPQVVLQDSPVREDAGDASQADNATLTQELLCTPKLLPVSWPEPVGPNVFILGEPVLQRYYTVFDWAGHRAGFALASHLRPPRREPERTPPERPATQLQDDLVVLLQVTVSVVAHRH